MLGDFCGRGSGGSARDGKLVTQEVVGGGSFGDGTLEDVGADGLHGLEQLTHADGAEVDHAVAAQFVGPEVEDVGVAGAAHALPGLGGGAGEAGKRSRH